MSAPQPDGTAASGMRRDTMAVTLCTLLSRLTGFGRVLATAAVLGSGLLADVYQTANLIPNLMFELVAGGVLQAVLVPSFVAARREGGSEALSAATRATGGVIVVGLAAVAVVGMALAPVLARLLVLSEPSSVVAREKVALMVPMVLVFVPQLVCYGIATVTSSALNARNRFVAAALAPAVNNIIVIAACIAFRESRDGAVADLHLSPLQFILVAGGTTMGVLAFSLTPALALRATGVHWWPQWRPQHPAVQAMRTTFGWATLSIVGTLVPTAAALALGNGAPGGVAVFVFAFAFYVLPHALIAVTVATTLAPRVAENWQAGKVAEVGTAVDNAMRTAVPLLVLAGAGMLGLAWPLTRLVAGIGQTASQGFAPIAYALASFGPGLLGYGVAFVMTRVLFALGDVRRAALLMVAGAVVGVVAMVVTSAALTPANRAAALAIGYGASQTIAAVLLTARVHRLTGSMGGRRALRLLGEAMLAGAGSVAVMLSVVALFEADRRQALAALLLGGSAGAGSFGLLLALLRAGQRRGDWRGDWRGREDGLSS